MAALCRKEVGGRAILQSITWGHYFTFLFSLVVSVTSILSSGRRGADGRLSSAQTALMLQEETIRRLERERKGLNEKISVLDSSLAQAEGERRQLRDKVAQLQQSESKSDQEKEAMRAQIENAESRLTKVELRKRSLEGKLLLNNSLWTY